MKKYILIFIVLIIGMGLEYLNLAILREILQNKPYDTLGDTVGFLTAFLIAAAGIAVVSIAMENKNEN